MGILPGVANHLKREEGEQVYGLQGLIRTRAVVVKNIMFGTGGPGK